MITHVYAQRAVYNRFLHIMLLNLHYLQMQIDNINLLYSLKSVPCELYLLLLLKLQQHRL
jgi:hypothetical protein